MGFDFHPTVGLIIACGYGQRLGQSNGVERSVDYGVTFQELEHIPKQIPGYYSYFCLVIVDKNTFFIAGGDKGDFFD